MTPFAKWFAGYRAAKKFDTQQSLAAAAIDSDGKPTSRSTIRSIESGEGFGYRQAATKNAIAVALGLSASLIEEIEKVLGEEGNIARVDEMLAEYERRIAVRTEKSVARTIEIPASVDAKSLSAALRMLADQIDRIQG